MSHIVISCPLTKLVGSLSRLDSADNDASSWQTCAWKVNLRTKAEEEKRNNDINNNDSNNFQIMA